MDILSYFNSMWANPASKDLVRKAMLDSSTNVGEGYIPENLEEIVTNSVVRLVPEVALPTYKSIAGKVHEFNRITSLPSVGSAMGESATTPTRRSTTERASVTLKVMRRKGAVTGFLDAASREYTDVQLQEIEAHLQAFGNDHRTYLLYGNPGADTYTYGGLDYFVATNRRDVDAAIGSLKIIDSMIDASNRKQAAAHRRVLLMSPEMLSAVSRLWTVVRDTREVGTMNVTDIQVPGGYRLESYRGVPIVETTATRPTSVLGTVTAAGSGSGALNGHYYFRVAAVTWDGEQVACAEVDANCSSDLTITFTLTEPDDGALFYKIYYSASSGGPYTLIKIVSAFTYSSGAPSAAITTIAITTVAADATSVPSHMQADKPLLGTMVNDVWTVQPGEYIMLWDLDEIQGLGKFPYTNENPNQLGGFVTQEPLAKTDDFNAFLLKTYGALTPSFEATSAILRNVKTE